MRIKNLKPILNLSTERYSVTEYGDIITNHSGVCKNLSPTLSKRGKGYLYVSISDLGVVKKLYVHQIVAKAFIDNPESKMEVNHIDGNTFNNHIDNLEWCTHSENIKHAWDNGMMSHRVPNPRFGELCKASKLTEDTVLMIRKDYAEGGVSYRKLAKKYNCSSTAIQSIIEKRSWKHL